MIPYEHEDGDDVTEVIRAMVEKAKAAQEAVTDTFNDLPLVAHPTDDPEKLIRDFGRRWRQRAAANQERNKTLYEEREAAFRHRRAAAQAELNATPEASFTDAFRKALKKDPNDFILNHANTVARFVEKEMAGGKAFEDALSYAKKRANEIEPMSGGSADAAFRNLQRHWKYGKQIKIS